MGSYYKARHLVMVVCTAASFCLLSSCGQPTKQGNAGQQGQSQSANGGPATPGTTAPAAPTQTPPPAAPQSGQVTPSAEAEEEPVDIGSVTIDAAKDANKGAPFDVDLVFIYDSGLLATVAPQSAADWFKNKAEVTAKAGSSSISVISWRVTPGEEVPETPIDVPSGALGAFLFANYASPGDHRQSVEGAGTLAVTLGPDDASVEVDQ